MMTSTTTTTTAATNTTDDVIDVITELRIPIVVTETTTTTDNVTMIFILCHLFYPASKRVISQVNDNNETLQQQQQQQQEPSSSSSSSDLDSSSSSPLRDIIDHILRSQILRDSHEYQEFCHTMNEQIQLYDQLSLQRKRRMVYINFISFPILLTYLHFVVAPVVQSDSRVRRSTWYWEILSFLWDVLRLTFISILCLTISLFMNWYITQKFIQPIIDQQNHIHRHINDICITMSQHATTSLASIIFLSPTITKTLIPENVTVTFRLGTIPSTPDAQGPCIIMDHIHIQCKATTTPIRVGEDDVDMTATPTHQRVIVGRISRDETNATSNDDQNSYILLNDGVKEKTHYFEVV